MDNAFEKARAAYGTGAYDDATLEFLFPQLKESEDERIRKGMIRFLESEQAEGIFTHEARLSWIAYLEKQKENPKSADSIPSDCASDAKCEDRWHKVGDSLPDNGRLVIANDCLGNILLARYDGEGYWEVSVYDNEDYYCQNTITKWCEIPSERQKEPQHAIRVTKSFGDPDGPQFELVDLQKEQNPLSAEETELNSIAFLEQMGYTCIPPGKEQKPAEWSEEDKKMCNDIIDYMLPMPIFFTSTKGKSDKEYTKKFIDKATNWLKSLHPSWKPSEEQMAILEKAVEYYHNNWTGATIREQKTLASLLSDLKKLL